MHRKTKNSHKAAQIRAISHTQKERLFHIDFKQYFLGAVNRTDLVSRFGIKEAAASRDLSLYKNLAPQNIEYDPKARTYIQKEGFIPLFEHTGSQTLAALLQGFGDNFVDLKKPIITSETPTLLNYPDIDTLACITRAIHRQQALKMHYRSLSSGLTTREIIPFALIDNGLRCHVRGYDRSKRRFSDFVINRIEKLQTLTKSEVVEPETKAADNQWNRIVEMCIVPHPDLKHPETIEVEYGMRPTTEGPALKISVRAALAGYVLRKWNVDCSSNHNLESQQHHLWLKNTPTLYGVENTVLAPGYIQAP